MAGLDSTGFVAKTLQEVRDEILVLQQQNIDAGITGSDDELIGQMNAIIAESVSDLWDLAESVNSNFDRDKAEGRNLDDLASLLNISRVEPTASVGYIDITANDGTHVGAGAQFSNPITGGIFATIASHDLSSSSCKSCVYSVKTLLDSTGYTITIDGTDYTYASDASATELEILNGIEALVTADTAANATAVVDAGLLTLTLTQITDVNINVSSITYISADTVVVAVYLEAIVLELRVVPAASITNVITANLGILSVTNLVAFSSGSSLETDESLRLRISLSSSTTGLGTVDAIRAVLLATEGVTTARIFENEAITVDGDGRPAKSFEALVEGGLDQDVGDAIWASKPAGIESHGTTTQGVTDTAGNAQSVKFTRPTEIHLAIRVQYTLHDEESFPATGEDSIKEAITTSINGLAADVDVVMGRLYGISYAAADGIDDLTIEYEVLASQGDTPTGTWLTTKLGIAYNEAASTIETDITTLDIT